MSKVKKEVLVFCIFLFLISVNAAYADEVGCCANPGAGLLACSTDRLALRDKECCPKPEASFPGYYKSQQNPDGPANSNECAANFFFLNKACSDPTITACALGCCCSELGGTIAAEAQCKGTELTFHKGQTNCNLVCPVPQCNDGFDNDNNGCSDFEGGDIGCTSPADKDESGGSCATEGAGCSNPNYIPKLSNLEVIPVKGQKKFLLKWKDECSETAVSYDVLRCKDNGCTNFISAGITNTNSFEDISGDLLFDTTYTYQIKARYNLQAATPTITKTATLGSIECLEQFSSNNFCIHESYYTRYRNYLLANFPEIFLKDFPLGIKNKFGDRLNKAFSCDAVNKLIPEGTSCSSTQICVINNNKPSCLSKIGCNYNNANPFGLYYTLDACENDRYCFYDRSHSTVDSCFACDTSMACYDYKTEEACVRDNCRIGDCRWKNLASQIGIGACTSASEYNCQWCDKKGTATLENLRTFNDVFDFCTGEKSNILSEGSFKCYFRNGKSKNCDDVVCKDYDTGQCSNAKITHDQNNRISNPSIDECGIKVCQNINNVCAKNADGDNNADCATASCESDFFAPNTTLLQIKKKGRVDSLIMQIYDRTSINSSVILKTSSGYATFLCVEPCGPQGHPYDASLAGRTVIITNLNAFDGSNGNRILTLNEGMNVIRFYSQDPAKNIEEVKKIPIEAHDKTDGPRILSINVSDSSKVLDKIYTGNQKPVINIQFFEPATITHSRLVNKKTGLIIPLQAGNEPSTKFTLSITETLTNGEFTFELNAKNNNNIFMDPQLSQIIIIDNSKPNVAISIDNGEVINTSLVNIVLTFDKEVNIDSIKVNSDETKGKFATKDNKIFTATIELQDGNKILEVIASDFAKNSVKKTVEFVVDAYPGVINLISPRFGTAPKSIFDLVVETDNNAVCRFSMDNNFEFDFMEPFTISGKTTHTVSNFNKIAGGDTTVHKLSVRCKDQRGLTFKSFDINVDATPPQLRSVFAYPNPIIEKPSITTLNVEADEPVICKFSSISKDFDKMEGEFEGFDNNTFKVINKQEITVDSEGNYLYYVSCKNKAELNSELKEISFKVDLSVPISIISHTPEFFNSTKVVLAIETNKKSQCKYSETDITAENGDIFGAPGYAHTRQLILTPGKYNFYIVCKDQFLQKFSDVAKISFAVDISPPIMLFVNDTSTFELFPEKTCLTDRLRAKWLGEDKESRVKEYFYSLIRKLDNKPILNFIQTFTGGEWVWVQDLDLEDKTEYFFKVKSKNLIGFESNSTNSDGITVDTSACKSKPACGDSLINQPGEECDKETFGLINSCTQYNNFIGGVLRCTGDCKLDPSGCTRVPTCGNGAIDPGEACDGNVFGQIKICSDYSPSLVGGTLKCTATCQLDTSTCTEAPKCGNKAIDKGESCDSTNLGPLSGRCIDYDPSKFTGGEISCNKCQLDTSKCQGIQGICGDGVINIGEDCDTNSFGQIKTCTDYDKSFSGGTLKCSNCKLDTSSCIEKPRCGNSVIDKGESCDSTNLGPLSGKCLDYSSDFNDGNLKCTDCRLDTFSCTKTPTCGNGRLDTGELCDGNNIGNITDLSCNSYSSSFVNGTLRCRNCRLSTNDCASNETTQITCKNRGDCGLDEPCSDSSDCASRFCINNKCTQSTCSDGIKNQNEAGIDCSGPCLKCQNSQICNTNSDCQSNFCSFGFCKPQESCFDGKLSPGESDIDCGGYCPTKCSGGKSCNVNEDCDGGLQCESSTCKMCEENDQNCNGIPDNQEGGAEDTDGDGMPDEWEIQNGLNPNDPNDAELDSDGDELTNKEEFEVQNTYSKSTNPNSEDTDEDGFNDKEEIDKGTSPVDPNDFPKSNLTKISLFILGIVVLLSGFGYLSYRAVQKRKEEKIGMPRQREALRSVSQQPIRQVQQRQKEEQIRIRESLKRKEEQRVKERKSLFGKFAEGKETAREETKGITAEQKFAKEEKKPIHETKKGKRKAATKPKKTKALAKKPKEDVFIRLKQIAKEARKKRSSMRKNAKK